MGRELAQHLHTKTVRNAVGVSMVSFLAVLLTSTTCTAWALKGGKLGTSLLAEGCKATKCFSARFSSEQLMYPLLQSKTLQGDAFRVYAHHTYPNQ